MHCGVRLKGEVSKQEGNELFNCSMDAQEIWAHVGKVERKNVNEGMVIQVYRYTINVYRVNLYMG